MTVHFWQIASGLGVGAFIAALFYGIVNRFGRAEGQGIQTSRLGKEATAIIATLMVVISGAITIVALVIYAPHGSPASLSSSSSSEFPTNELTAAAKNTNSLSTEPSSTQIASSGSGPVNARPAPAPPPKNTVREQEYDDYTFQLKECRLEDREDKQINDGKPHKQLICKVLVTNNSGDRKLTLRGNVEGARTRVIDDGGAEYDVSGGTLGTSQLTCYAFAWPDGADAALDLPSGVPVMAVLAFGVNVRTGIGYFSPDAKSLGILDVGFISNDTASGKPFHIQFKNVPIAKE